MPHPVTKEHAYIVLQISRLNGVVVSVGVKSESSPTEVTPNRHVQCVLRVFEAKSYHVAHQHAVLWLREKCPGLYGRLDA